MTNNINYLFFLDYIKRNFSYKKIRVLDFGCGRGEIVQLLIESGINAVGVDVYLDEYHSKCNNDKLKKEIKVIPVKINKEFPFEDSTFDLIISNQVFEHVENMEFTVSELSRVLKKDGVMYHHFPSREVWREGHIWIIFSHWFPKDSKIRYYYVYFMRMLGFGRFKDNFKSIREFAEGSLKKIDEVCFYRPQKEIEDFFSDYNIKYREIDYIKFRARKNGFINRVIKFKIFNNIIAILFRRLAFMSLELRKK